MAIGTKYPDGPKFFVQVTQEQIEDAVRGDSSHCMISEALKVARPEAFYVSSDLQTIRFTDKVRGLRFTYLTPRRAQVALLDFDHGIDPEPFRFRLQGAQVTASGSAKNRPEKLRKTRLVPVDAASGEVPRRVGGTTPPVGPLADPPSRKRQAQEPTGPGSATKAAHLKIGKRRAFGLRAMGRTNDEREGDQQ